MPERVYFRTLTEAMRDRNVDPAVQRRVTDVVSRLATLLGAPNNIYVGQRGNAIGLSLGTSRAVDVYIHKSYLDIAPSAVERAGGIGELADAVPGIRRGTGQRAAYARVTLR